MHHRPLALVSVLAGGDYLLWNWSLQGSHDVLALVSGLTLTPLVIALIWLLALNGARLLARIAQQRSPSAASARAEGAIQAQGQAHSANRHGQPSPEDETYSPQHQRTPQQQPNRPGGEQASSSSKLAA